MKQIIDGYRGNCEEIAEKLVNAANESGGKDNVSVIFVAGPEFSAGKQLPTPSTPALERHAITRVRTVQSRSRRALEKLPWLLAGTLLGILIWAISERLVPQTATPAPHSAGVRSPVHIVVNAVDARGIMNALADAVPGDTIDIPPGDYLGPLVLKNGVNLVGSLSARPVIRTDPAASANSGVAILVSGVRSGRIENLEVVSDGTRPLRIGISVVNSAVHIVNSRVSGAIETGIRIEGKSEAALFANTLTGNFGAGITVKDQSWVHLSGNWVTNNGKVPGALRAGLEVTPAAHWEAANNLFLNNGLDDLSTLPQNERRPLEENNLFARSLDREPGRKSMAGPPAARK
jgi:parallel beta-helix repeat protein